MNKNRASSTAPARTALGAAGESRPLDAAVAALILLLGLLFRATPGSALACGLLAQFAALLRAWFPTGPRAATPEQHARALRDLRRLHARHILPDRTPRVRPSSAARRRLAECWRMLINPPRRRASFARPTSSRPHPRHALARAPHPRARPPPAKITPDRVAFACPNNITL
jgi:hypothetical protein